MAENNDLKLKIKKLSKQMEENVLLDYELSGCMKDKQRRDIFKKMAKHKIIHKKKYAYIDQETTGKFLVQQTGTDKGIVWGIKAYGQKGRYVGDINKITKDFEKANQSLIKQVMQRSLKNKSR